MSESVIIALVGVIGVVVTSVISAIVTTRVQRPAMRADAAAKIEAASIHFAEMLKKDNDELRAEIEEIKADMKEQIDSLESEIESLRIGITILLSQLQDAQITPKWTPQEKDKINKED